MSNFMCEHCGVTIIDTPKGYMTGCPHHPIDNSKDVNKSRHIGMIFTCCDCGNTISYTSWDGKYYKDNEGYVVGFWNISKDGKSVCDACYAKG